MDVIGAKSVLRVLSLGAGVQSTTLARMAARGEIGPMPDCAIFSDTGWEPKEVYDHLNRLERELPFPVIRVNNGNIRSDILAMADGSRRNGKRPNPPFYVKGSGVYGLLSRGCTEHYKLTPIRNEIRRQLGIKPRTRGPKEVSVEIWIGISTDEASRMKPARDRWASHRWPLIEARMSRWDCLRWLDRNGHPRAPKSSCIGCPYHSDTQWRDLRDRMPEEWRDALAVDDLIRNGFGANTGEVFMHRSCKPLNQVDLSTAEDRGQLNMFNNECEGMCGV